VSSGRPSPGRFAKTALLCLCLLSAPAAAQSQYGNPPLGAPAQGGTTLGIDNDLLGRLGGAAVGAIVGSQFGKAEGNLLAIGAGGLLGYFAGGYLMDQLNPGAQGALGEAEARALDAPVGEAIAWETPGMPGTRGTVTPVRDGQDRAGNRCREFEHVVRIDGRQEVATGTACRDADGRWRVVEQGGR
jgi:surface antigen